ncbi:MAG: hypothetical protein ACOYM2_10135 [Rectinemataceae bacterium]
MNRQQIALVLLALATLTLALACGKQAKGGKQGGTTKVPVPSLAVPGGAGASSPAPAQMRPVVPAQGAPAPLSGAKAAQASPPPVYQPGPGAPSTSRYLNLGIAPVAHIPLDFHLGPLSDVTTPEARNEGIVKCFAGFLDDLVAGQLRDGSVLPENLPIMEEMVGTILAKDSPGHPVSWRMGRVESLADEALVPFALFAEVRDPTGNLKLLPRADGELRGRLSGEVWLIDDISFDAEGLLQDRQLPRERFEPDVLDKNPLPKEH